MFGLGENRKIRRGRQSRRLCQPCPHATRPRHHGGLRSAEKRERERARLVPYGGAALGRARPNAGVIILALRGVQEWANDWPMSSAPPFVQAADALPELNPRLD